MIVAVGDRRTSLNWINKDISWEDLCTRFSNTFYTDETEAEYAEMSKDRRTNTKDIGGLVGGELNGSRNKDSVVNRCILALDIDYGTSETWDDYTMLCDWECFMHTTHSHTKENPRYRMYFPLKRLVSPEEYVPIARMIANSIDIELFDDTTFETNRLMFWPSTCKDGEFLTWHQEGPWIDPDQILGMYDDWRDESQWPISRRVKRQVNRSVNGKQADPRKKTGIVGAFCRAYTVYAAIEKFLPDVYLTTDEEDRYTYAEGSTIKGLKVFDDGLFARSWHDSDPAHGRLCNAFDLVRLHLFPSIDEKASFTKASEFLETDPLVSEDMKQQKLKLARNIFRDKPFDGELAHSELDFTETGNGIKIRDMWGAALCHNPSLGWCVYSEIDRVWYTDAETAAKWLVMLFNDKLMEDAKAYLEKNKPENVDKMKKTDYPPEYNVALNYYAWAKQSRGYNVITRSLNAAKSVMNETPEKAFDSNPWMLNTPDGIVNLKTGELGESDPGAMCTMITKISPDRDMEHPKWDIFLDRITCGDKEYQAYLQTVAGMALVGKVYEENLIIAHGSGSNGKSTLFMIWQQIMGSYATTVRNEVILGNRFSDDVFGVDRLRGKRLVIAAELKDSQVMSTSVLKKLTSHDIIEANVKFKNPVTFEPSHTLVLHTNQLPRLSDVDGGTKRRLTVLPFKAVFTDAEKKNDYADELIESEGPAILSWMIDGAIKFYTNHMKLEKPDIIVDTTKNYIESEDTVSRFIEECCENDEKASSYMGNLYRTFSSWIKDNGLFWQGGNKSFRRKLENKGYQIKRDSKGWKIDGLVLADEEEL